MPKPWHSRRMLPRDGSSAKGLPWCHTRGFRTGTAQFSVVFPSVLGTIPQTAQAVLRKPLTALSTALPQSSTGWGRTRRALVDVATTKTGHPLFCFEPKAASWLQQSRAISACQPLAVADICLSRNASPGDFTGICPGRKAHFNQRVRICFQVPICSWSRDHPAAQT